MTDLIPIVAKALELSKRKRGVRAGELAEECGINRDWANKVLVRLTENGFLTREGDRGRAGYTYRKTRA